MPAEAVLGIEIPQGDPDALRSAAGVWGAMGDKLSAQAGAMSNAAAAVVGADWSGPASLSYSFASSQVSIAYIGGSFACNTAAGAAKRHAADLEEAQTDAKAAIRDAIEANDEMGRQRKIASAAHNDRGMALQRADRAAIRGATAQGAGPAGAGEAISAGNEESAARDEAGLAGDRAALAERRACDAADLLEQAQKRGHQAKRRGDRAGEVAARVYREVAGEAQAPLVAASPAVPVSLRGASPGMAPFANFNPFAGRFHTPGTPSHARAMQIAFERAAADDRERELEGGADDRFGGELKGYLGIHLFGDPDVWGGLYTRHGELDRFRPFDGSSMLAGWEATEVAWDVEAKRPRGDFCTAGGAPVFTGRAVEVLGDLLEGRGELLALAVSDGSEAHAFNVTRLSDALDCGRSELDYYDDGRIMDVDGYVFEPGAVAEETIFKLAILPRGYEYVTDRFPVPGRGGRVDGLSVEAAGVERIG